jgi:hypothetical protein
VADLDTMLSSEIAMRDVVRPFWRAATRRFGFHDEASTDHFKALSKVLAANMKSHLVQRSDEATHRVVATAVHASISYGLLLRRAPADDGASVDSCALCRRVAASHSHASYAQ